MPDNTTNGQTPEQLTVTRGASSVSPELAAAYEDYKTRTLARPDTLATEADFPGPEWITRSEGQTDADVIAALRA